MRSFLARVRMGWRRAADLFPPTGLGLLVLLGSALALLYYGLARIDLILLVVGTVGLGVAVLALLVTTVAALLVRLSFRSDAPGEALSVECGFATRTGFRVRNPWYLPLVDVSWTWLEPVAEVRSIPRRGFLEEEIVAARRGITAEVLRRVEVADIFGLCRVALRLREPRTVRFLPSVGKLKQIEVLRGMAGGDDISHPEGPAHGDPIDMRHYAPGDPIKFVLWKVFARARKLVVRTPEKAISPARQTVAYLVAYAGDEPAAGAARVAVDGGALGSDWVVGADGSEQHASTRASALDLLTRSAHSDHERAGLGLSRFLGKTTTGTIGRALVFVPARPGPWIERVLSAAAQRRGRVDFVVCTDGIVRRAKGPWWRRAALVGVDGAGAGRLGPATAAEVREVVTRLGGARAHVIVVDRAEGRMYTAAHLEGLEAA